jgi:hypothetical protein
LYVTIERQLITAIATHDQHPQQQQQRQQNTKRTTFTAN